MVLLLALLPAAAAADPPLPPPPAWQLPQLHYRQACLNESGWHDIAGALTFDEKHHVFQGCPNGGGWSHATSRDLVHWEDLGISGPRTINETFAGMQSNVSPCRKHMLPTLVDQRIELLQLVEDGDGNSGCDFAAHRDHDRAAPPPP